MVVVKDMREQYRRRKLKDEGGASSGTLLTTAGAGSIYVSLTCFNTAIERRDKAKSLDDISDYVDQAREDKNVTDEEIEYINSKLETYKEKYGERPLQTLEEEKSYDWDVIQNQLDDSMNEIDLFMPTMAFYGSLLVGLALGGLGIYAFDRETPGEIPEGDEML